MKENLESKKSLTPFTESGTLIFLFTIITYYFVAKKTEIEYELLGIPTQFIDYPFYSFVTQLEGLILEYLPMIIFLFLSIWMSIERRSYLYSSKNRLYISESYQAKSEKSYSKTFIVLFIAALLAFGYFSFPLDGKLKIFNFMSKSFFVTFIALLVLALFKLSVFVIQGKYITLKTERLYTKLLFFFVIIVLYGNVLIVAQIFLDSSKPYETIIKNVEYSEEKYQFEFLVAEKTEYSVWAQALVEKPLSKGMVQLDISKDFKMEKTDDFEVSNLELHKKIIAFGDADPVLRLRFKDWDEVVYLLNISDD